MVFFCGFVDQVGFGLAAVVLAPWWRPARVPVGG
jgi:hypothetical protein